MSLFLTHHGTCTGARAMPQRQGGQLGGAEGSRPASLYYQLHSAIQKRFCFGGPGQANYYVLPFWGKRPVVNTKITSGDYTEGS